MTFEPGTTHMMRRSNAARHTCWANKTVPQIDKVQGQACMMLAIYIHCHSVYIAYKERNTRITYVIQYTIIIVAN